MVRQKKDEYIKQLTSKIDVLTTHNKMLEAQIAQQASSSSTPPSRLPSKREPNPREQWNAMILRVENNLRDLRGIAMMTLCMMRMLGKRCLLALKG